MYRTFTLNSPIKVILDTFTSRFPGHKSWGWYWPSDCFPVIAYNKVFSLLSLLLSRWLDTFNGIDCFFYLEVWSVWKPERNQHNQSRRTNFTLIELAWPSSLFAYNSSIGRRTTGGNKIRNSLISKRIFFGLFTTLNCCPKWFTGYCRITGLARVATRNWKLFLFHFRSISILTQ